MFQKAHQENKVHHPEFYRENNKRQLNTLDKYTFFIPDIRRFKRNFIDPEVLK